MAELDLTGFNIVLVDDNPYMVSLLRRTFAGLGVGNVKTFTDVKTAIDFIKLVNDNPTKAGMMNLDFIVSNWQMAPIDGLMFLRWIRTHGESPNKFIPFLMVTGFGDKSKVEEARDLGVTEVLAKPFSVNSVADKVLQLLGSGRQFVQNKDYFGPDRRRQSLPIEGDNRRLLTEKDPRVKVIYE